MRNAESLLSEIEGLKSDLKYAQKDARSREPSTSRAGKARAANIVKAIRSFAKMAKESAKNAEKAAKKAVKLARCHHCKKPIHGQPVSFQSEGKPARHYHAHHAHRHGPTRSEEEDWRGETELSEEATTPEQRQDFLAEKKTKGAKAK